MYLADTEDVIEEDEKTHMCNVCEKEFSSHTNLQRHVTILHLKKHWSFKTKDSNKDFPENETLRCNLCPLNFSSASEKIQHLFEIHEYFKDFPTPPNPTKNSSYDANIQSQFKENESKKDEKKVKFDLELNSTNDVTAEEETRQKQLETLSLDVLDRPRPIIGTPKSNENTFHKCKICNKIFTFQGILNFHMITSHEPKKVAIIQGFSPYSPRVQEVRDGDRTTLLLMRCCHIVMPRRGKETQVRLRRYLTFPSDVLVHPFSSLYPSLNRRPKPHSIHYSRMLYVAGETNSCWGQGGDR